ATLTFAALANASGTAKITVTVMDDAGVANGGHDTITRTFNITVTPVNQQPTLNVIPNPPQILENAGTQTVGLTGLSAGLGDSTQTLTITATSNNQALLPNANITVVNNGDMTGTVTYTPAANMAGN